MNEPTPPSHDDALAWMHLTLVPGVGPGMQRTLLGAFGSPHAAVGASTASIGSVVGMEAARALARGPDPSLVEKSLAWLSRPGNSLVTLAEDDYPKALLEAGHAPCVLYARGRRELLNAASIAIVGSRNATPVGMRDAEAFARALSNAGLCIVSGLARGIDGAAHRGGLGGAASTIAVMGTGADRVYPAAHRPLAQEIAATGCVLTEFPIGTPASTRNFPRRNRLISGLARGVLVVEAASRSGSLITAKFAGEQGREVFAVPGSIHSPLSKGCHELIRDGAKLVQSADDVLAELGMASNTPAPVAKESPNPLLHAMGFAPISIDQMAERTGLAAAALSIQLTELEIDGRITSLPGGWFQRLEGSQ